MDAQLLIVSPALSGQKEAEADQQTDGEGGEEGEPARGPVTDRQGQGEDHEEGDDEGDEREHPKDDAQPHDRSPSAPPNSSIASRMRDVEANRMRWSPA